MRRTHLWAAVAAAGLVLGCARGRSSKEPPAQRELLLFCGAGIRPPAAELAEAFGREHGVKILADYAGAEVLMSKIKLAGKGDLYMPGDRHYVDLAAGEGLVLSQSSVCYFVPTILVQKGNPKKITGLRDLVRPGVKLGLGNPRYVPVGTKAREIFKKNNIPWTEVEKNLKFLSATVNELGMHIQAKSLDAVIVWDAVARYYAEHGAEIRIPAEQNVISTVDVGVLKFARDRGLASKFVEFAASERGRAIFKKHRYRVDPPK